MKYEVEKKSLRFKRPAKTSRGEYTEHDMWIVTLRDDNGHVGVGECAPLPDLSSDRLAYPSVERVGELLDVAMRSGDAVEALRNYPALLFAYETALADMDGDSPLCKTPFALGEVGIPINGLVWMSSREDMLTQIETKLELGFRCIKLKIGAIGWDDEMSLLKYVRSRFSAADLELRVDANGAFAPSEAMKKLDELSKYDIHSIEQPIRQHQWDEMRRLCEESPLPIALDEELIGIDSLARKQELLDFIKPQYVVIKPTLHGGMTGTREWIDEARKRSIGSWITSALESNIGLRGVARLAADIYGPDITFPQGLGTGQLFTSNYENGITIIGERLWTVNDK